MKKYLSIILAVLGLNTYAQTYSLTSRLYDDSQPGVVTITMEPDAYQWMFENPQSDSLHRCTFHFTNALIDSTVENVGIRIRGNTSREANKKSLKISFNDFEPGREFYDVDKMNLNGEHNDPSISRAKLCWDIFNSAGIKASKAAHCYIYINGVYHGVYVSVEHIDDEFLKKNFNDDSGNLWKCLYPADLVYKGSAASNYYFSDGFPAYELTTNEETNDYTQLARFINLINNTPSGNFQDSLETIFNYAGFLEYQAINFLTGSWDDYWCLMNNYYLYYEPSEGKFTWIPYDYDNSFGIDWFSVDWASTNPYSIPQVSGGSRPLTEKMLNINQYRDLYTHFIQFYRNNIINPTMLNLRIDSLKNLISNGAFDDTYRTLDYGFSYNDFLNSFTTLHNQHVKYGLKDFVQTKHNFTGSQLSYQGADPIIYKTSFSTFTPDAGSEVSINAAAFDSDGIDSVILQIFDTTKFLILEVPMMFFPVSGTTIAEEADNWTGRYSISEWNTTVYAKIRVKDSKGISSIYPRASYYEIKTPAHSVPDIVVNEFLADNAGVTPDPAGENDDWVELYNNTGSPILLTGFYMTDDMTNPTKWRMTDENVIIPAKGFLVVWCDDDAGQDGVHASFKLSKGGEFIGIVAADGVTFVDSLSFGEQSTDVSMGRFPDGSSEWMFLSPTPGGANQAVSIHENLFTEKFAIKAYPNPFKQTVKISFTLKAKLDVSVEVFSILGCSVYSTTMEALEPGEHSLFWNAGSISSSGIYFCRINAGNYNAILKLMLLK